jgi:hypothetical protein
MDGRSMVATTDTLERAMIRLSSTELMLGDLQDVAAEWDTLSKGERAAWSIEWDNEMAGLSHLSSLAACGELPPEAYSRYRQLILALNEAVLLIEQIHLSTPEMYRAR